MNERLKEISELYEQLYYVYEHFDKDYGQYEWDEAHKAIGELLSTIKSLQAERDRYREALQNVVIEYIESDATNMDMAIYNMNRIALSALREEEK